MFQSQLAELRRTHSLSVEAVTDVASLLQQAATARASVLTTVVDAPAPVKLAALDTADLTEEDEVPVLVGSSDRYEDLGLLGTGGMGEARRVRDRDLDRAICRCCEPGRRACLLARRRPPPGARA